MEQTSQVTNRVTKVENNVNTQVISLMHQFQSIKHEISNEVNVSITHVRQEFNNVENMVILQASNVVHNEIEKIENTVIQKLNNQIIHKTSHPGQNVSLPPEGGGFGGPFSPCCP